MVWTRESGIRIGVGYGGQEGWAGSSETIVLPDGTYRMYYCHEWYDFELGYYVGHILSAVSTDGITWTKEEGVRVDRGGTNDLIRAGHPNVINLLDGTYRMYYVGYDNVAGNHAILSAVSTDGVTWTKEEGIRIEIGGIYDGNAVLHPEVVAVQGGFIMFYGGENEDLQTDILSAVSMDGLDWNKESGIRINLYNESALPGDIVNLSDNQYRMYFHIDRHPSQPRLEIRSTIGTISPLIANVQIDIKPGSEPNSINVSSAGVIPVAILSSETFDATQVDPETVFLAGAGVKLAGKSGKYLSHEEDINGDGLLDSVCQVYTAQFMIETGHSSAELTAETFDGRPVRGEDSINIVPDGE